MPSSRPQGSKRRARKPADQSELQKRSAELESLFANAPVGLAFVDREHRYLRINERLAEMNGLPVEAHLGRRVSEVLPVSAPLLDAILDEVLRTGRVIERQIAGETPKQPGVIRHYLTGFFPVFGKDSQPIAVGGYVIEVTDRIRAEEALRHSEERFRAFVNAGSDVVFRMSADWSEMRQLDGEGTVFDHGQPNKKWLQEYIHRDDHGLVSRTIRRAVETGTMFRLEHRVRQKDGSVGWMQSCVVPIRDTSGEIIEWFGTATDITHHKKAEEGLIRSEKLASVGRMAATIAHEINNPLAAVMNLLYLAQHDPGCPESIRRDLGKAEAELMRVSHITRQVLGFYRDSSRPVLVSLPAIMEDALGLFEARALAKAMEIERQYGENAHVASVPGDLRQIFSNLISNSVDAMQDGGGILKIRISQRTIGGRRISRITISDNGNGIQKSALPHIFEPLFTTKESVGTGLGLWVSKQLVEKHGGSIRFRSSTCTARHGTTFVIDLPMLSPDPFA